MAHLLPVFWLTEEMLRVAEVWQAAVCDGQLVAIIRTDACASPDGAFIGGWWAPSLEEWRRNASNVKFFLFRVDPNLFPSSKASPNNFISALEALAVTVACLV